MRIHPRRQRFTPALVLLLACTFAILLFVMGLAVTGAHFWARFLLPIVVVFLWGRSRDIYIVTAFTSILVAATFWLGESATFGDFLANHVLPIAVLWAAAWLLASQRRLQEQLLHQQQELEQQVAARTAELRAGEQRYRILTENSRDLVYTVDMNGKLTYVSPAVIHMRGVTPEEEIATSWEERMTPSSAASVGRTMQADLAALRAGEPVDGTPRVRQVVRKDGTFIWTETIMSPLFDDDGKPLGLCGFTRDVTARHTAEDALRRSEERLAMIFRSSPAGITITRLADGCVVEANEAFLHITGYTRTQLVGRSTLELEIITPGRRAAMLAAIDGHGYVHGFDMQIRCASGATADLLASIEQIDYDGEPCLLVHTVDITERKRLEQALRESEERFRLIVHNSPDVVALYDQQGRMAYISPAVESTHGFSAEHALALDPLLVDAILTPAGTGHQTAELDRLRSHPYFAERRRIHEVLAYCLANPGVQRRLEIRRVNPAGEVQYVDVAYRAHQRVDGNSQVVAITRDISERKRLEQALQALNADLEDRVVQRTASLEAALADLRAASRLKDEFMAMISHELRTPLTGVLSLSELLEDQVAGPLNNRQATYVRGIIESGERLLNVINGILSYTHLLAGKVQLQAEPCELSYVLGTCVASQQSKITAKGLAIAVRVEPADLTITSDAAALAEVIKRLLDNAIKFTPEGGQIGLEAHRARAASGQAPDVGPGTVDIVVWDTGIGIAAGREEHVFHAFVQGDSRLARTHEGIGMGLAYAAQMVRHLGGTLGLESSPGAGSRFTVRLPA